jgi:hypothetical protein
MQVSKELLRSRFSLVIGQAIVSVTSQVITTRTSHIEGFAVWGAASVGLTIGPRARRVPQRTEWNPGIEFDSLPKITGSIRTFPKAGSTTWELRFKE